MEATRAAIGEEGQTAGFPSPVATTPRKPRPRTSKGAAGRVTTAGRRSNHQLAAAAALRSNRGVAGLTRSADTVLCCENRQHAAPLRPELAVFVDLRVERWRPRRPKSPAVS